MSNVVMSSEAQEGIKSKELQGREFTVLIFVIVEKNAG